MNFHIGALVVVLALSAVLGQTRRGSRAIFVSPIGDDTGSGTAEHPFRTVQHGVDAANPGDVVTIQGGKFDEAVRLTRSGNYFGRSITIQAAKGESVVLAGFDTGGQDHVTIRGLTVRNSSYLGISIQGSYRVRVEDCKSESSPGSGLFVDKSHDVFITGCDISRACQGGGEESVSIKRSTNVVFEQSAVHDTGHEGIDVKEGSRHVVVRGNRICHVERQGLYADAWDADTGDIRFENNTISDCMVGLVACTESGGLLHDVCFIGNVVYDCRGPGMMLAKWGNERMTHRIKNVSYINNTVVHCGGPWRGGIWAGGMLLENDQAENVTVVNNVFSDNPFAQFRVTFGLAPKGIIAHNNLIDGPGENITKDNLVAPVKFLAPEKKDFRLAPGSAGIGGGATVAESEGSDPLGKPRLHDGHVDIGAFRSGQ